MAPRHSTRHGAASSGITLPSFSCCPGSFGGVHAMRTSPLSSTSTAVTSDGGGTGSSSGSGVGVGAGVGDGGGAGLGTADVCCGCCGSGCGGPITLNDTLISMPGCAPCGSTNTIGTTATGGLPGPAEIGSIVCCGMPGGAISGRTLTLNSPSFGIWICCRGGRGRGAGRCSGCSTGANRSAFVTFRPACFFGISSAEWQLAAGSGLASSPLSLFPSGWQLAARADVQAAR